MWIASPVVTATLSPNLVKSGDTLQINASTDIEVESLTARIFGDTINLIKQADGTWSLNYTVPEAFDGNYFALLTATNSHGNQGTAKVNFTVDNTPPVISAEIIPGAVKPGEQLQVNVESSDDAESVSAAFSDEKSDLTYSQSSWEGEYNVPSDTPFGTSTMSVSAFDTVGNQNTVPVSYDILDPASTTTPSENQGSSARGSQTGTANCGSGGGSTNNGASTGSQSNNGGSSNGGSSGSNNGGLSPGGGGSNGESHDGPQDKPHDEPNSWTIWDIFKEVFGSPDFDVLALIALLGYMASFLLSAGLGLLLGWTIMGIIAASFLFYVAILFIITILILIWALYMFYSRPKS